MKSILLVIIMFGCVLGIAQNKKLTDNSYALGILKSGSKLYAMPNGQCTFDFDQQFDDTLTLIISDIYQCEDSYTGSTTDYFQFLLNESLFYALREDVETDSTYFDQLKEHIGFSKITFYENALSLSKKVAIKRKAERLKSFSKQLALGLLVMNWSVYDESEYTDGASVDIEVYNSSKKTIKYIWFSVVGFNPVGDKIYDYSRKSNLIIVKGIGPIEPAAKASYEFEYVWFTDLVSTAKIATIKVQYMDGTYKSYTDPKLLFASDDLKHLLE